MKTCTTAWPSHIMTFGFSKLLLQICDLTYRNPSQTKLATCAKYTPYLQTFKNYTMMMMTIIMYIAKFVDHFLISSNLKLQVKLCCCSEKL